MAVPTSLAGALHFLPPRTSTNSSPTRNPSVINRTLTTTTIRASSSSSSPLPRPAASSSSSSMPSIITELEKSLVQTSTSPQEPVNIEDRRWRKLAGEDNWSGLLDPLDRHLRSELLRYGEMSQACYDAFDYDLYSIYCGSCKYDRRSFFRSVGLPNFGYDITRYLYATNDINLPNFLKKSLNPRAWSDRANWAGFVAVSDDATTAKIGRRDIVVAWRGTVTRLEWIADLSNFLTPVANAGIPCPDPDIKVEYGFLDLYTDRDEDTTFCNYSAREQVLAEVHRLLCLYQDEEELGITITGHSLGAALAILNAYDMAETKVNVVNGRTVPICVHSFSGPRVGNRQFKDRFEKSLNLKALRVVNVHDKVPTVPGVIVNENVPEPLLSWAEMLLPLWSYKHVGVELRLDHKVSPYLKDTTDPVSSHNLEAHLHLLDGYEGKGEAFASTTGRDPALVNKASDFLKDDHLVPPNWRQDENRGMVKKDGRWMQAERAEDLELEHSLEEMRHYLSQIGLLP